MEFPGTLLKGFSMKNINVLSRNKAACNTSETVTDIKTKRLLRTNQVLEICSFGPSTLYKMIADGTFPKPLKNGPRMNVWPSDSIVQWLEQFEAAGRNSAEPARSGLSSSNVRRP